MSFRINLYCLVWFCFLLNHKVYVEERRVHFWFVQYVFTAIFCRSQISNQKLGSTTNDIKMCFSKWFGCCFSASKYHQLRMQILVAMLHKLNKNMKIYANYLRQHVWCNDINFRSFVNRKIKMVWHPRSENRSPRCHFCDRLRHGAWIVHRLKWWWRFLSWLLTTVGKINLNFGINFDHRFKKAMPISWTEENFINALSHWRCQMWKCWR